MQNATVCLNQYYEFPFSKAENRATGEFNAQINVFVHMEPNGGPRTREAAEVLSLLLPDCLPLLWAIWFMHRTDRLTDWRTDSRRWWWWHPQKLASTCATMRTQQFVVSNVNSSEINCAHAKYVQIAWKKNVGESGVSNQRIPAGDVAVRIIHPSIEFRVLGISHFASIEFNNNWNLSISLIGIWSSLVSLPHIQ